MRADPAWPFLSGPPRPAGRAARWPGRRASRVTSPAAAPPRRGAWGPMRWPRAP